MNAQDPHPKTRTILHHIRIGMAVGLVFFLLFGLLNVLLIMGGTAVWFKQFIQGGEVPPGARDYLLKTAPVFAISALSHGLMGLLLGGIWGVLL